VEDNEAVIEQEEELNIIDLLTNQSEETEDTDEAIDTDTDDIEILKERISKRNKSLKKSKQANHRIQDEKSAQDERIEELEKKIASLAPNVEAQNREQTEAYDKLRDSVTDNPGMAVDLIKDMQDKTVDYLARQEAEYESKLAKVLNDLDPEKSKYRDKISSLKTNPQFAGLDDDILIKVIKATESVKAPRGNIGGKRATVAVDPEARVKELREKYRKQMEG
jgi:hypothetical protein